MKHETAIPVGSGGMGEVFKAWDPDLERYIALKYLKHDDPVLVERLMREARAQARIDHPSVCKVYEVGEDEGRPYIAMEFVEGEPLDVAAKDLTTEQKVLLVRKITEAIQAAHAAGLVHRDLKPANILVVERDGEPHPYVLDFGIARIEEVVGLTMTGQVIGTPGYLSPEQARGDLKSIDRRTDVFSLGVILYELLSEKRPFTGESQVEILLNLMDADPPPLRAIAPQVSRDLETVVMTCLEKDPERRYPSARSLADDLGRFLDGEPVEARPVGLGERLVRKSRKNPFTTAAIAAAALAVVALFIGGIGGWVKYTRDLERERDVAEASAAEAREITEFMTGVFALADPDEADGKDVTAREILERGAVQIEDELGDRPEIQARLLGIMGEVFSRLGQYDRALPLLERALALVLSLPNTGPEMEIEARVRVADLCVHLSDPDRGHEVINPILQILADSPDIDPNVAIQGLGSISRVEISHGKFINAEKVLSEAIRRAEESIGPAAPVTGDLLNDMIMILDELERRKEAVTAGRRALEIRENAYGPDDPRVATTLNNLQMVLGDLGEFEEAADMGQRVLEMRRRLLGPDHPRVASALNNLGLLYKKMGDLDQAETYYVESLEIRKSIYGHDNPRVALALSNLGGIYRDRGDFDRAETFYGDAVMIFEAASGPTHPSLISPLAGLARTSYLKGEYIEAERVIVRILGIMEASHGPDSLPSTRALRELARNRLARRDFDSAQESLEHARRILVGARGETDEGVGEIDEQLAQVAAAREDAGG